MVRPNLFDFAATEKFTLSIDINRRVRKWCIMQGENFPSSHLISRNLNTKTDVITQRRRRERRRRRIIPHRTSLVLYPNPNPIAADTLICDIPTAMAAVYKWRRRNSWRSVEKAESSWRLQKVPTQLTVQRRWQNIHSH